MSGRKRFLTSIFIIIAIFFAFIVIQSYRLYTDTAKRTTTSLIDQYYRLMTSNPEGAKRALELILEMDPSNQEALRETGFWYLRQGDTRSAVKQFKKVNLEFPNDELVINQLKLLSTQLGIKINFTSDKPAENKTPMQLSYINPTLQVKMGMSTIVSDYLHQQMKLDFAVDIPVTSTVEMNNAGTPPTAYQKKQIVYSEVSLRNQLINEFYMNKNKDQGIAWTAINKLLLLYPNDLVALKEAGYYALNQDKKELSIDYFIRGYNVSHDPYLALQVGYILNSLNRNKEAYDYFDLATKATDLNERLKAELALTNLRGVNTRLLPTDYFGNLLFYPFYRSRFKLLIYPLIARVGYMISDTYQVAAYISYRRTSDNKSNAVGALPQIFEDNVAITSIGIQATPLKNIPITGFVEAGKAVDLVYKNRARWRNDFRIGLLYYNDWGKEARYTFKPTLSLIPNADLYADVIYFSRYLNTIATARARPGIEVFRYASTSINIYYKVFLSEDASRIFYNNILEVGPSIAFTPNDRYNISIRYESLKGYYLPSGGPFTNPYASTYHNNMIFLDTYIGI